MNQYHQLKLIYLHRHVQLHEHTDEQVLLLFLHIHHWQTGCPIHKKMKLFNQKVLHKTLLEKYSRDLLN